MKAALRGQALKSPLQVLLERLHRVQAGGITHAIADLIPKPWYLLGRVGLINYGIPGLGQAHSADGAHQRQP